MVPLSAPEKKKNRNLLSIGIVVLAVIVVIVAVAGYLYMDDQNKQNQKSQLRESLAQAYGDQQNETARQYALIGNYPAAGNKNYVDDFQRWVAGYRRLSDNYSLAAAQLATAGAAYQVMLANDSSDYANVTAIVQEANGRARSISSNAAGYERDYQAHLGLKTNASAAFDLALNRSKALYDAAWSYMQQDADKLLYGNYLVYLRACDLNNTLYNNSISLARDAGTAYQAFLQGSDYDAVNASIAGLQDSSAKLGKRYLELQGKKPDVELQNEQVVTAWAADKGFYKVASFVVVNNNRLNNTPPMKIHDVVVHYRLIDTATGKIRSTADVSVTDFNSPDFNSYISNVFTALLLCDQNGDYATSYTIEFQY